jgi:hypothetical protein
MSVALKGNDSAMDDKRLKRFFGNEIWLTGNAFRGQAFGIVVDSTGCRTNAANDQDLK